MILLIDILITDVQAGFIIQHLNCHHNHALDQVIQKHIISSSYLLKF